MSQFGIHMYTLRDHVKTPEDFENTLKKVAEMGYKNVQITCPPFTNSIDMAAQLKRHGLKADSAYCSIYELEDKIDEVVAAAKALETDVLRTDSISSKERYTEEGYHEFAKRLNRCGKLLFDRGLKFMYHFHAFEFIDFGHTRGIDILLEETDPKYVYFQPDVFWLTAAGTEPSTELKRFKGRALYMHLKDYQIVKNDTAVLEEVKRCSAPVGTGNLNWVEIIRVAKEIGIVNFVVEDDMGVLNAFESAETSIKNMKKLGF